MATYTSPPATAGTSRRETMPPKGAGWVTFAGMMVVIAGILNTIWGIAAIGNSHFFVANAHYVLADLNTWGWVMLVIGVLQIAAAFSIWAGGSYGRWVGVIVAAFSSIAALLSIPAYPFWALAIFAIDILVMYGLVAYGGNREITA